MYMTINQTMDSLLSLRDKFKTAGKDSRIDLLRDKLLKLKMSHGGNSEIPDKELEEYINNFIEHYSF